MTSNKQLASVIVPTYNRGYILSKAIQSVLDQKYPFFELIIADDGSTDNTKEIVAGFTDERIKYLYQENGGRAAKTRNLGLRKAQGEFVCYLDSDDVFYPDYISTMVRYFKTNPETQFAVPGYDRKLELEDASGKVLGSITDESAKDPNIALQDYFHWKTKPCGTGIFHRAAAREAGISWDENLETFEDLDYIMQLGNLYPHGFARVPAVLFGYVQRYGGDGVCSNTTYAGWADGFEKIYLKHKDDVLMQGQAWYPTKVQRYRDMQKQVDRGEIPPSSYKHFPQYYEAHKAQNE